MGDWNDPEIDNDEAREFVGEVVKHLEQPAQGIAKLYVDKGLEALSGKQRLVLRKYVFGEFATKACARCGHEIPWSEQYGAYDNGRNCGYCAHMIEKNKSE